MRSVRWLRPVVVVAVFALVVTAVLAFAWPTLTALRESSPTRTGNTLMVSSRSDIAAARSALDGLAVVVRPTLAADYRRAAFGKAWQDVDGNGCNQRDDVLFRDVLRSAPYTTGRQRNCTHDMLAGTWVDPYTGASITLTDAKQQDQAQSVQIDHIVALSVAWRYGAHTWSDARRQQFANDLTNLAAVGGASNQGKGGADAAGWRPVTAAQCGYAVRYVHVKAAYRLPVDATEKGAVNRLLDTCP